MGLSEREREMNQQSYKLLVAGSRDFANKQEMFRILDALTSVRKPSVVIAGGAPGADRMAAAWAKARGIEVVEVLADWSKDGKSAGFRRNERMVKMLTAGDQVVAFYGRTETPGTKHTVEFARAHGFTARTFATAKAEVAA